MNKMNILTGITLSMMLVFTMNSCNDDSSTATHPYNVRMTDAPGPYDAVYIDLQGVEITGNGEKTEQMNVHTGIYNLLDFSNGMDTLIATGSLEASTVNQMRLILGSNNSVVVDGINYPLSTPSSEQSGLKLQVHQVLEAGVLYSVLLDFDANKSIVLEGNGTYKLKPVIRTIVTAESGTIQGKILPVGTMAIVTATSSTSYSSNVSITGDFQLIGLPEGMYILKITPELPLNEFTKDSITVITGVNTNIGTIELQ